MIVHPPEFLLTTHRDLRGDAVVDRGWTLERHGEGRMAVFKTDRREVRPIFSVGSCLTLVPRSVVHLGYGFLHWPRRDQDEAYLVLRAKLFVDSKGVPL